MKSLIYRIADCAYQQAHAMPQLDDCQRHLLIDICEGENKERIKEFIQLYLSELNCKKIEDADMQQREYIVRMVLAEWLADIDADTALNWLERAQSIRPWPTCRKISPF